ncbi:hypothetical protein [Deinococcus soli (ex Cha et al. 2016)]|uniref:Uncharacterized protein n=2 Tax=Deinococcus soli (ex Cha et al. 2016) TaxID=1309411 RepID=A0AAE3XBR9_9DEIO|nr:hypothetical protein [Deinococcus soli (ex Cha et al. 2016)]MDR6218381.1 hypothetical protein [Deinococcus soli (ex Cha et al. 2016)]MDR6329121.1 hypothetical protein [Deinococcus soli (ex Cha et al. 2016)]MDR6751394.1 hypothetical protein [Deinococcus soli (ex Cha et al. 2016)]
MRGEPLMEAFLLLVLRGQCPHAHTFMSSAEAYAAAGTVMQEALRGTDHPDAAAVQTLLEQADAQGALRMWRECGLGVRGAVDLWVVPQPLPQGALRTANTRRAFITLAQEPVGATRTLRWALDAGSGVHFLVISEAGQHQELALTSLPPGTATDLAALRGSRVQDGNYATVERTLTEFSLAAEQGASLTYIQPEGAACHLN